MALVVLLRGVNVGGHRTFRPSRVAHELRRFEVVNIGAAGTFVVLRPQSRRLFRVALSRVLPITAVTLFFDSGEIRRIETLHPFGPEPEEPERVRFVSFLAKRSRNGPSLPVRLPAGDDWHVQLIASAGRFVFGEYRRHMRTIVSLGKVDTLFGVRATTRRWSTVGSILRALPTR
ncbi:MAG: hypothetical protein MNPFHGCM_01974 [Gemmatimonadaceae bacterium]|nr:hypothetical protein [Gemmatimonadaceae bacterium]